MAGRFGMAVQIHTAGEVLAGEHGSASGVPRKGGQQLATIVLHVRLVLMCRKVRAKNLSIYFFLHGAKWVRQQWGAWVAGSDLHSLQWQMMVGEKRGAMKNSRMQR